MHSDFPLHLPKRINPFIFEPLIRADFQRPNIDFLQVNIDFCLFQGIFIIFRHLFVFFNLQLKASQIAEFSSKFRYCLQYIHILIKLNS